MEFSRFYYCILLLSFPLLVILAKYHIHRKQKHLPPSPPGSLPIIGHFHLLKQPMHRSFQHLSYSLGPIFSLKLGCRYVVVISSPSEYEECFTKNDIVLANRPRFLVGKHLNYNHTTVGAAPYGPLWRNLRRVMTIEIFSTTRLNKFMGIRQEEVKLLLKDLYRTSGQNFAKVEMKSKLSELSFNIIMRMVTGKRFFGAEVKDREQAKLFREIISEIFYLSGAGNPGDFIPILQWFDYQNLEKKMIILQKRIDEFMQGLIDESRDKKGHLYSEENGRKTTIDSMLDLQEVEPENYTDEIIKGIILILLEGGIDTSAVTMEWAMSLLLNHPEMLERARVEIDNFVGQDRLVEESDISKLPYIQAIINETLRLFPAVPVLTPHESSAEFSVGGYDLPAKTMVLINAWAIHRDPKIWDDPTSFKPERFLGVEGDAYKLKLVPFGMGRRGCPGAVLANRVMTLALAGLIQCFEWERIGEDLVDMTEGTGLSMPKIVPLEAICKAREKMIHVIEGL